MMNGESAIMLAKTDRYEVIATNGMKLFESDAYHAVDAIHRFQSWHGCTNTCSLCAGVTARLVKIGDDSTYTATIGAGVMVLGAFTSAHWGDDSPAAEAIREQVKADAALLGQPRGTLEVRSQNGDVLFVVTS